MTHEQLVEEMADEILLGLNPKSNCGCGGYLPLEDRLRVVKALTTTAQRVREETLKEAVAIADRIELSEPDGGTKQWMAFKTMRNTLRDMLSTLNK